MAEFIQTIIIHYGLIAIFFFMITNGFLSFPPSEILIVAAGILALTAGYSFWVVLLVIVLGNLLGTYALFLVGRNVGYSWVLRLEKKFPRYVPSEQTLKKLQSFFQKKGAVWVAIFRCVPVLRSIISLPAGVLGMRHNTFIQYSLMGIIIWAFFWQSLGYFLADLWREVHSAVSAVLFIILIILLWRLKKSILEYTRKIK